MNHTDVAALMKGMAPVIRDLIVAAVKPVQDRVDELERLIKEHDYAGDILACVKDAVGKLPPAVDGKDGAAGSNGAAGRDGIDGKDGASGTDGKDGAEGAVGKDGLPGGNGKDGANGKDGLPGVDGKDGIDGTNGVQGERGLQGPAGELPIAREFVAGVNYQSDIVTHKGATYQALKDTASEPPHADWICLASAGANGADGRSFRIRGTYVPGNAYEMLDTVALNGGAFVAKKDAPGDCPGEDWQLIASQGKAGKPGDRGLPGRGDKGDPGPAVVAAAISEQGLFTLVNADGSSIEADFYPVLDKVARR
ncbi:MAG: hypothetical protein ABJA10_07625 [Aestuariivirga sp.]